MGRALPGFRLWIDDGELCVDPATVPTFFLDGPRDRPWRTGDRVREDEDGYLWFEGRTDDVIISAGYRIGPFEVESALISHPAVAEAAAVAAPDEVRGQVVRAVVVLRDGHEPGDDLARELQEHVRSETAPYKYPRIVEFADSLPKTASGKIKREPQARARWLREGPARAAAGGARSRLASLATLRFLSPGGQNGSPEHAVAGRVASNTCPTGLQARPRPTCCNTRTTPWTGTRGARRRSERAQAENRPILLSIGYSACHWCHVMERESFEDAGHRAAHERALRVHQARPRGAARRGLHLHGGLPGHDRERRLAPERLPHPRAGALLRRAPTSRPSRGWARRAGARCWARCPRPGRTGPRRSGPAGSGWPSACAAARC